MMMSTAHETAVVKTLVPGPANNIIEVGSVQLPNGKLSHPTVGGSGADVGNTTIALTGANLVNSFLFYENVTTTGAVTLNLPSAADIVAAFAAARSPLSVGDCFSFTIARGPTGTYAATVGLTGSTGVTFATGITTVSIARYLTGRFIGKVVTLGASPTISIHHIIG